MRPGSQPSQKSTARRAEAGVAPPHHTGTSWMRLGLEVDIVEVVQLAVVFDRLAGPEPARDERLLAHHLGPRDIALADDVELVLEVAGADAEVEATPSTATTSRPPSRPSGWGGGRG